MKTVKYVLSGILFIAGLNGLININPLSGVLSLILAILIFPVTSSFLMGKINLLKRRPVRIGLYLILVFAIGATASQPAETKKHLEKSPTVVQKGEMNKIHTRSKIYNDSFFWNDFDPIVKQRIIRLIEQRNCEGLQIEFNTTSDHLERLQQTGKDGSRNLALMNFLNSKMDELGCYQDN